MVKFLTIALLSLFLFACRPTKDEITKEISRVRMECEELGEEVKRYAARFVDMVEDSLSKAEAFIKERKLLEAHDEVVKASVYIDFAERVSVIMKELEEARKAESKAKSRLARTKAQLEILKSGLYEIREAVPEVREKIQMILDELEKMFEKIFEKKPVR